MAQVGIKHTNHKQKRIARQEADKRKECKYTDMEHGKVSDSAREAFFRPAYGKIGERKEH